jgi:hypothetical protein
MNLLTLAQAQPNKNQAQMTASQEGLTNNNDTEDVGAQGPRHNHTADTKDTEEAQHAH